MKLSHLAFALTALVFVAPHTQPAHADLAPSRLIKPPRPAPRVDPRVEAWLAAAKKAMASGDLDRARALCDVRGFETNLSGGGGTTLASLFGQGHRKRWHLEEKSTKELGEGRFTVRADVVDNETARRLDALTVLLIPGKDGELVALGASEREPEVMDLLERLRTGKPLAPQEQHEE